MLFYFFFFFYLGKWNARASMSLKTAKPMVTTRFLNYPALFCISTLRLVVPTKDTRYVFCLGSPSLSRINPVRILTVSLPLINQQLQGILWQGPGTNAVSKSVNVLYTDEKNRFSVETVKPIIIIKTQFKSYTYNEFYSILFKATK